MVSLKFCGPKCSVCWLIISIWGTIQLFIMGILFYVKSVALLEELGVEHNITDLNEFYHHADERYNQNAYNCFIAGALYLITFLVSGHQLMLNSRNSARA